MARTNILSAIALPLFLAASIAAQSSGTKEVTDTTGGNNEIHLDTTGPIEIKKVERWNPWTEKWEEIKPDCIKPNPGKSPVIDFGEDGPTTEKGEKFRFEWKAKEGSDSPFNHAARFLKDKSKDC